jgi:hypothetical protein
MAVKQRAKLKNITFTYTKWIWIIDTVVSPLIRPHFQHWKSGLIWIVVSLEGDNLV